MTNNVVAKHGLVEVTDHVDQSDLMVNYQYSRIIDIEAFERHTCWALELRC